MHIIKVKKNFKVEVNNKKKMQAWQLWKKKSSTFSVIRKQKKWKTQKSALLSIHRKELCNVLSVLCTIAHTHVNLPPPCGRRSPRLL